MLRLFILLFLWSSASAWAQCRLAINPDSGALDCLGGPVGATGAQGPAGTNGEVTDEALQSGRHLRCADAGASGSAYTCTMAPVPTSYVVGNPGTDGQLGSGTTILFKPNTSNTGAATLAIGALAAKAIKQTDGTTDPSAGNLAAGRWYALTYDGTAWQIIGSGAVAGAAATWGSITGTLSNQTDLQSALNLKAPLASPTFTGTVTAPNFAGGLTGAVTGNASTATALAANGANCAAGQAAGGVSAAGAAEACIDLPATYQPLDPNLTSLAGVTAPGIYAHTGVGAAAARTITGTTNEVAVTDGDGVAANPTISLPPLVDFATKTVRIPNSTTLPVGCVVGNIYMDTDAATGQRLYLCEASGNWVVQGAPGIGEANTTADAGGGLSLRGTTPKTGSILNLRTLAATAPMTVTQTTDLITMAMPAANGTVAGYLSVADYVSFTNRYGPLSSPSFTNIAYSGALTRTGIADGCASWASGTLGSTSTACVSGGPGGPATGTVYAKDFTSSQYWLYPYSATPTLSQHGIPSCDYARTVTSGNSEVQGYDIHCHATAGTQTVNGQTVGQYDLLVSWTSANAGRVSLNYGGQAPSAGSGTVTASGGPLVANRIVLGADGTDTKTLATLGSTTTLLHGNAAGAPSFGAIVGADITNATIDLTTKVTGILPTANGGTNNAFFAIAGPAASLKTYTLPNVSSNILTDNATITVAQGGTGAATLTGVLIGTGTAAVTASPILGGANGGTGNGFFAISGPAAALKTFTLPNASASILTDNATITVAQGGTGAATLTGVLIGNGTGPVTASAILGGTNGGTGNAFFAVTGPTTALRTFTFPNASATVLTSAAAVTGAQGGTGLSTTTQGDLLFGAAGNTWAALAKNVTATRYLSNAGTNNDPAWSLINLANGVTGQIPSANLGSGTANTGTYLRGDLQWAAISGTGTVMNTAGALTNNAIMLGAGTVESKVMASLGTTTTLLHGNAAGAPTFGAVGLTTDVSGILPGANGGSGNGFFAISGPAAALKTYTLPNASANILTDNAVITVAQGGTGAATLTGVLIGTGTTPVTATAILGGANGGTGNGFFAVAGPATTLKTYTLPNASATLLTDAAAVTGAQGGTGTATTTQGDLLFGAAGNTWSKLPKNATATRYLSNTGASNDPAWAQVSLATGVTGTVPLANLGTSGTTDTTTFLRGDNTWQVPTATVGTNVPSCTKYPVSETTLTAATNTQDITVVTLPARTKIQGITIEPTSTWAGSGVTTLTVSLGVSGNTTAYTTAYTLMTGSAGIVPGATVFQDDGGHFSATLASHAVLARFTSTGAVLNVMSAGAVAFSICSVVLP